jgi:hypothetical protein
VLRARRLRIAVTDIDWRIICSQYKFDRMEVLACYKAGYDYLPEGLRDVVLEHYRQKTALKGVVGQELYYAKHKELI